MDFPDVCFVMLSSLIGAYLILRVVNASSVSRTPMCYLLGSLVVTIGTMGILLSTSYLFFTEPLHIRPIRLAMALMLTSGYYLASIRYTLQLSNEKDEQKLEQWKIWGAITGGISYAGLPIIYFHSVADLQNPFPGASADSIFLPYLLELVFVSVLGLVPSFFSDQKIREKDHLLAENQSNYDLVFQDQPNPAFLVNTAGQFLAMNTQAENLLSANKEKLLHQTFFSLLQQEEREIASHYFQIALDGSSTSWKMHVQSKHGSGYELDVTAIPVFDHQLVSAVLAIVKDVTEEKQRERLIEQYAYEDDLTGLPNRRSFLKHLQDVHQAAEAEGQSYALFFLDMDRFKHLNDSFGHSFGDKIIREFAARIQGCLSPQHLLFRLGGDEFTILIPDAAKEELEALARLIIQRMNRPFQADGIESYVTASIGIAIYPVDGTAPEQMMSRADASMYQAKGNGKNTFRFYSQEVHEAADWRMKLEGDLRRGIEEGQLVLHYQPKYNIMTNTVTSAEALVRWNHPVYGMIPPNQFIGVAEETGLIVPLERWVIRQACEDMAGICQEGLGLCHVAVNLSQVHFHQEDLVDYIQQACEETGFSPSGLEIEVTESTMMNNQEVVVSKLCSLRELGIQVSMDDFGTGYSSLSSLKTLPINCLKIDRSFIQDVLQDESSEAIVSLIISMAEHLNLNVIAEGVETEQQVELLRQLECREVQGYFYSKPLPLEQLIAFLQRSAGAHSLAALLKEEGHHEAHSVG
ncbi:putative bifunctional diguanylate cyclase/phosphodiesterase [Ectobacillus ponti]|uniref:EAL domain-containing protein n=1 Tax=Ectobacillus ponti TaxID=2961894 RepID=A0AA41XCX6_9BACI|nr:EAL domain-containing protein [Ectobacillus ponti]MCP8971044.1 EAL domain-containing protein [Ectobacillus ponti]